jgi:hypothetical protein
VAAIGRRVNTLCKREAGLRQQLALFHGYHNFVLPHASLRLPLPALDTIPTTGAIKRWQLQTPAMAAGLGSTPGPRHKERRETRNAELKPS